MNSPIKLSQHQLLSSCRSYTELHMLYSMLPKQFTLYPKSEFKKTKDFYRPGQCIWNNPHRTSERLFKYYHQGIQYYKKVQEPQITEKEQEDRKVKEMNRIISLSKKREETRTRFHSKQLERLNLENTAGLKRNTSSQFLSTSHLHSLLSKDNQPQNQQPPILRRSNSESLKNSSKREIKTSFFYKKMKAKPEEVSQNERSYLTGVQNFDMKNKVTLATIKRSEKEMKDKIRENFLKQKENNSLINDSRKESPQGKLLKSTLNRKTLFKLNFMNLPKPKVNNSLLESKRC